MAVRLDVGCGALLTGRTPRASRDIKARYVETKSNRLDDLTDLELIHLRTQVRAEIRKRGIADSVGSVGEQLAIEYFRRMPNLPKLQPAPRGTKNVDALSRSGDRFSIKTICEGAKTGTVYPEPEDKDKQLFEYMLIVKLTDDWSLNSVHQLSWSDFLKVRSWDKRMNAWYVGYSDRVLKTATVILKASTDAGPTPPQRKAVHRP